MSDSLLSRRAFATAAAWSIPVVSAVLAVPAVAASLPTKVLTFSPSAVTVNSCSTVADLTLLVTSGGSAVAGTTVTLSLPAGFSWADGTAGDKTVVTGPSGAVMVSVVQVALRNGDYLLRATADSGESGTATITVTTTETTASAWIWDSRWEPLGAAAPYQMPISEAVRAVGYSTFMTAGGAVVYGTSEVASSVSSAVAEHTDLGGGRDTVTYVSEGVAATHRNDGIVTVFAAVPADAVAVGTRTWLTPGGELYLGDVLVASGVTSAVGNVYTGGGEGDGGEWVNVTYVQQGVGKVYNETTALVTPAATVGAGAKVVGALTFLTSSGDLYSSTDLIASGVENAYGAFNPDSGSRTASYRQAGVAYRWGSDTGTSSSLGAVPDGSTLIGSNSWISPSGDLFWNDHLVASSVVNGTAFYLSARDRDILNYVVSTEVC